MLLFGNWKLFNIFYVILVHTQNVFELAWNNYFGISGTSTYSILHENLIANKIIHAEPHTFCTSKHGQESCSYAYQPVSKQQSTVLGFYGEPNTLKFFAHEAFSGKWLLFSIFCFFNWTYGNHTTRAPLNRKFWVAHSYFFASYLSRNQENQPPGTITSQQVINLTWHRMTAFYSHTIKKLRDQSFRQLKRRLKLSELTFWKISIRAWKLRLHLIKTHQNLYEF